MRIFCAYVGLPVGLTHDGSSRRLGYGLEVSFVVKPISPVVLPAATKGFMSEN